MLISEPHKTEGRFDPKKFFLTFFIKFFFGLKNTIKSSQHEKLEKKFFLGQIGLQFFAAHWSAISSIVLRLAVIDRKINGGDFDSFIVKISWGEHLHFYRKGRKTSKLGRSGTNGLTWIFFLINVHKTQFCLNVFL